MRCPPIDGLAAMPRLAAAADAPPGTRADPSAAPYRPGVSTPATLPAPGWLEIEGGWSAVAGFTWTAAPLF